MWVPGKINLGFRENHPRLPGLKNGVEELTRPEYVSFYGARLLPWAVLFPARRSIKGKRV